MSANREVIAGDIVLASWLGSVGLEFWVSKSLIILAL